jgi:GNAT superfamily N-acetyltransferase
MQIRQATPDDKEDILKFVRDLAVYERKPLTQVGMTLAKIEKHGFGDNPYFQTLLVEQNGNAVAFALYFYAYSGWAGGPVLYVEDLFVAAASRHQGVANALVTELAKLAIVKECCRMEWCVYDWNEQAIAFYKSLGAVPKADLIQYRLSGDALSKIAEREYKKL